MGGRNGHFLKLKSRKTILSIIMNQAQKEFEILDSFNTSWGLILTIKFTSKKKPDLGQKIIYNEKEYYVSGILLHASPYTANIELQTRMQNGIYDCTVKPA